jgi:predicted nucleotidyltransferase
MITGNKISEIVNKIASGYHPEKIILFGSYANGNASDDSDIDIFVIKDSELPRPERTIQLRKMLFGSQVPMDLIVYTPSEVEKEKDEKYSFVYEVLNSGKTVYERKND